MLYLSLTSALTNLCPVCPAALAVRANHAGRAGCLGMRAPGVPRYAAHLRRRVAARLRTSGVQVPIRWSVFFFLAWPFDFSFFLFSCTFHFFSGLCAPGLSAGQCHMPPPFEYMA